MRRLWLRLLDFYVAVRCALMGRGARPSGILLTSSGGIGDTFLFSLIAPRFEKILQEGEKLTILVRKDTQAADFVFPANLDVISVDYRRFLRDGSYRVKTSLDLYKANYRIAIATDHLRHPLIDDAMIMATKADERLSMQARAWKKWDGELARYASKYSRQMPEPGLQHRLINWVDLANWVLKEDKEPPVVAFPKEYLPEPSERRVVVLHPFSAIPERQYGPETFLKVIDALPEDLPVVLSAGPGDLDRQPDYKVLAEHPRVEVDYSSFMEKASLIRSAVLVVSVDTSLMHLAVGCGAPTLCLATAAHVVDSIPYDDRMIPKNVRFLLADHMDCKGCLGNCTKPLVNGRYACIAEVAFATVEKTMNELLKKEVRR